MSVLSLSIKKAPNTSTKLLKISPSNNQTFQDIVLNHSDLLPLKNQIVAVKINGKINDLSTPLSEISEKATNDTPHLITLHESDGLEILRHTTTHVMAYAIKKLQPNLIVTIGPVIENGFFYDFDDIQIKQEDLKAIEKEMSKIISAKLKNKRIVMNKEEALKCFSKNPYKLEIIKELPKGEVITCYKMGNPDSDDAFFDLCRGPHLPHTGMIKAFKLLRIAGAYWRGKSNNKMLTRVYGTSFPDKKSLVDYIDNLKRAELRDHNRLGKEMGIFTSNELVGQGLPLLTPKGTTLKKTLETLVETEEKKRGYEFVQTPYLSKSDLFKVSGHWNHYKENMFVIDGHNGNSNDTNPNHHQITHDDGRDTLALRPMTCPFHFCLYNTERRSYRELPVRYAETSVLFRNESSGEMHGLIRLRQFTLSDGHIICTEEQVAKEFQGCLELIEYYLDVLHLKNYWFRLSKWDSKDKEKYVDEPEAWEKTQVVMKDILDNLKVNYVEADGEAAFYGPKLDLQMKNAYGKEDTIMTIQLDFALPTRFKMRYIDANDNEQTPYVIHRGSIGCYERTIALLIEEYEGKFPFWLSPEQVVILSIKQSIHPYIQEIHRKLLDKGIRSQIDIRAESLKKKVREAQLKKITCILTIGEQEEAANTVSVRTLAGNILKDLPLNDFVEICEKMNQERSFENQFDTNSH